MSHHWVIIHNPKAASGRAAKMLPAVVKRLHKAEISFEIHSTEYAGHAELLTKQAVERGERFFVAFGGDGTVNEVANGILKQTLIPTTTMLLTQFPTGTGNDWRRTHGISKRPKHWPEMLKTYFPQSQDVGLVEWVDKGRPMQRYFINIASLGFGAYAGRIANAQKADGNGGMLSYISALIKSLKVYKATSIYITMDKERVGSRKIFSGAIGICSYNGGGMKICPDAMVDDGWFDFTLIGEISKWEVIKNLPGLFSGRFITHPAVEQLQGREINIQCQEELLIEVDGENIGAGPAWFTLENLPLRVAVPDKIGNMIRKKRRWWYPTYNPFKLY